MIGFNSLYFFFLKCKLKFIWSFGFLNRLVNYGVNININSYGRINCKLNIKFMVNIRYLNVLLMGLEFFWNMLSILFLIVVCVNLFILV